MHEKLSYYPVENYGCNCQDKISFPLDNQCFTLNVMYEAEVTNNIDSEKRVYLGASETTFRERYRMHVRDTKHEKYYNSTQLSKHV